jgi:hypothetical protein
VRDDKILSKTDAEAFLRSPVIVEEKVDGANLGISFDPDGNLLAQNRGSFLKQGAKGQFAPLWAWLSKRESHLFDVLQDRMILFGEWCYARHSIHYTRLPDWFLAFDVLDKNERQFLNTERRSQIARDLDLSVVPRLGSGTFQLDCVAALIGTSALYNGPMEGIYLRQECGLWLTCRAKVVRPEFVQQIGEHWSKQLMVPNELSRESSPAGGGGKIATMKSQSLQEYHRDPERAHTLP